MSQPLEIKAGDELNGGIVFWLIDGIPWVVFDGVWPPEKVSIQIQLGLFEGDEHPVVYSSGHQKSSDP